MSGFWEKMIHDRWVGAFAASSRYVQRRVLAELPSVFNSVVEYGPGDGVVTREVLKKLPSNGTFQVIERNRSFVKELVSGIRDSRLVVIEGDAVEYAKNKALREPRAVDVVLSSIPLSFLSSEEREILVQRTHSMLRPDGVFVIFHQYSLLCLPLVRRYFRTVEWHFEIRNIFPCFVVVARP